MHQASLTPPRASWAWTPLGALAEPLQAAGAQAPRLKRTRPLHGLHVADLPTSGSSSRAAWCSGAKPSQSPRGSRGHCSQTCSHSWTPCPQGERLPREACAGLPAAVRFLRNTAHQKESPSLLGDPLLTPRAPGLRTQASGWGLGG